MLIGLRYHYQFKWKESNLQTVEAQKKLEAGKANEILNEVELLVEWHVPVLSPIAGKSEMTLVMPFTFVQFVQPLVFPNINLSSSEDPMYVMAGESQEEVE